MLALWIAMYLGLPRPYWAMGSVYIVAHPLSGATRSKALYRVLGTLLGAAAGVAMVPPLVNSPPLLMAAVAIWVACLLYVALLHRTPRSYAFMLAAYTLPLALPSVDSPMGVFDLAVARRRNLFRHSVRKRGGRGDHAGQRGRRVAQQISPVDDGCGAMGQRHALAKPQCAGDLA